MNPTIVSTYPPSTITSNVSQVCERQLEDMFRSLDFVRDEIRSRSFGRAARVVTNLATAIIPTWNNAGLSPKLYHYDATTQFHC